VVTSQTAIKPDGYTQACAHALESATYPAFWYKKFTVPAGQIYSIEVQLRKSTSMAYLPRVYLMASIGNPLAGAAPVDTFTMTNSTDTWESDTFTVDNSAGDYDLDYALWFVGQNATGSVYSAYKLRQLNTDLTLVLENLAIVDTVVDAIKLKTDQLTFTVANQVDANALTGGTSAEDVADAVWDEAIAGHTTATTFGGKNQKAVPSETISDYTGISTADILAAVADGTMTVQDSLKILNAALAGKLDGGGTGTLTFRDPDDTTDRIVATVDLATGDRDNITLDLT